MEPPRVQYVKTPDGVNLAYYEMGEGPPFVYMHMPQSHLTAEWQRDRAMFTMIASRARLVRFDPRGVGLSDRDPPDISLDAHVRDLETVLDRLELSSVVLHAAAMSPPIAIAFAARHPERVTRLILVGPAANVPRNLVDQLNHVFDAAAGDWRFASESMPRIAFTAGWDEPEDSAGYAELLRQALTFEEMRRLMEECQQWDVRELLPLVRAPTLVVSTKSHPWHGAHHGREIVAALPKGQLAVVDDTSSARMLLESARAVMSFLGVTPLESEAVQDRTGTGAAPGMAVILFTDIVDSTALTERLGDAAFRDSARALDEGMRAAIIAAGGTPVDGKVLGDGVMAIFASAAQAIDGARRCLDLSARSELRLHLGIHAGDVIREPGNVYGGAVNIASRICALSQAGEILVSATIRDLARTSANVAFEDRGEHALKGIDDPVRVFAVRREG